MDVTDEDSVRSALHIVKDVLPKGTGLWAVVNNAGIFGPFGLASWLPKSKYEETINVNFLGTVCVTTTFLPLVRRAEGRIVNMSSVVGRLALFSGPYTVSKYCVEGYTDWLRFQLLPHKVSVHTIEPGGCNTSITNHEIQSASLDKEFDALSDEMKEYYGEGMKEKFRLLTRISEKIYGWFKAESVADVYVHAVSALYPKQRYLVGLDAHLFFRPMWTAPTWLADFIIASFYPARQK